MNDSRIRRTFLIAAALLICLNPVRAGAADPKTARELYDRVTPSLVVVQYTYDGELGRRELSSTGIVVSEDGLVVTSSAITPSQLPEEQMKDFKIIIPGDNETELGATFQGRDERAGLAYVKAKDPRKWTPLKFEDVPLSVGEPVISIGLLPKDAGYRSYLVTATVAAMLRGPVPQVLVSGEGLTVVGSPVLNAQGQAIGMVHNQQDHTAMLNDPRQPMGQVNNPPRMFVPARDFLISLNDPPVDGNPMKLPHLGVAQLSGLKKEVAEYFGLKDQPAVQVGDVMPGFAAAKAGLKSGDVIVKVNGQPLDRGDDPDETPQIMTRKIMRMKVGQQVVFSVISGKDQPPRDVTVTLDERPPQANKAKRFFAEDLGFAAREMVFEDTYVRRLPADTKGVVIALIKPSSAAQTAKLQAGDLIVKLNQTSIEGLGQFKAQYDTFRKDHSHEAVVLEVLRGVNTQVVRIEPPQ